MRSLIIILLLSSATARAETDLPPQHSVLPGRAEIIVTDTHCLMQTLPGFDPQVLTPRQVTRLHAVLVEGDGSGFAPQHDVLTIAPQP